MNSPAVWAWTLSLITEETISPCFDEMLIWGS
ncbi:rCG42950 [Rattus norvegicus]|uniref:RCG42950 n=1 Tax=Rattus norvegicus TaxID=10116 RepID=A6IWQ5_RAT|nr:rCG42950 [Rattus norvegicus]